MLKTFLTSVISITLSCICLNASSQDNNQEHLENLINESSYVLAKSYLNELKEDLLIKQDSNTVEWYINYGRVHTLLDEHDTAFKAIQNAIQLAEELNSTYLYFKANTQLIELYRRARLYNRALFLVRKLKTQTLRKDPMILSRFFHRAAAVYNEAEQSEKLGHSYIDTAIALSELSLEISNQFNFKDYQATSLNELGNIYEREEAFEEALNCYKKAIHIRIETKGKYLANAVKNLGSYYLRQNSADSALFYFRMVLKIMENCKEDYQIYNDTYWGITKAYLIKGDSINYLKNSYLDVYYNNKLLEDRLNKKIQDLSLAYEAKEKDLLIQENKQRIKKEAEQKKIVLTLLLISLIIISTLIYLFVASKKKIKELQRNLKKLDKSA